MTKTDLRIEALKLAVGTVGQPNIMEQAKVYLDFLAADFVETPPARKQSTGPR